jgi:uncharacterized protein (DUF1330 family)
VAFGAYMIATLQRAAADVDDFPRTPNNQVSSALRFAAHGWQDGAVTAYWISIYREIVDEAKVAAYGNLARPALVAAGGTFLARSLPEQIYEAGENTRTVLIEFESVEAARNAHDSEAYADALAALDGGAVRDLRIVPGVE